MTASPKLPVARALIWTAIGMVLFLGVLAVSFATCGGLIPLSAFLHGRAVLKEQRFLLHEIDHRAVAAALREYAARVRWDARAPTKGPALAIQTPDDRRDGTTDISKLPPELRRLHPQYVRIDDDQIDLVYGGPFGHYGLTAFRPGVVGMGSQRLGEELWFFTDDHWSAPK